MDIYSASFQFIITCHFIRVSFSSNANRTTMARNMRAMVLASLSRLKLCSQPMYSLRLMLPFVLGIPLSASRPSRQSWRVRQSEEIKVIKSGAGLVISISIYLFLTLGVTERMCEILPQMGTKIRADNAGNECEVIATNSRER